MLYGDGAGDSNAASAGNFASRRVGNVTPTPSPLPVREGAVYPMPNHEVMGRPELQSRLSKGVIAKVVQRKELARGFWPREGTKAVTQ